jgi:cellulose synthase/poly-beta-1,6-N-acetylglucosamine synthase-like glycosyltransferase
MNPKIKVCVVAHNEQERIIESLVHLANAINYSKFLFEVHIVANGCSDYTIPLCESFCKNNSEYFTLHKLKIGDKANAWNYFIYEVNVDNDFSIFIDGDCYISINALDDMFKIYQNNKKVNSISGFPATIGRGTLKWRENLIEHGETPGNFYSLTPLLLTKIKKLDFKLPFGLIGDDSLLSWVCGNNFTIKNVRNKNNFGISINSLFYYERLVPNSIKNIKFYFRRLDRYSLRRLQQKCIREYVDQHDFLSLPHTINDIYQFSKNLSWSDVRWDLINTVFDIKNLYFIKKFKA